MARNELPTTRYDAIARLDAERDGDLYHYYAHEVGEWYAVTGEQLDALAELMSNPNPDIRRDAYSHWCASGNSGQVIDVTEGR